jgi:hypothetical protein
MIIKELYKEEDFKTEEDYFDYLKDELWVKTDKIIYIHSLCNEECEKQNAEYENNPVWFCNKCKIYVYAKNSIIIKNLYYEKNNPGTN